MSSLVACFCGGRGSGKTLSMSGQAVLDMLGGEDVWANYPINFAWQDENGQITEYASHHLEIDDLISFKPEIRHGKVCLDELNLWAGARGYQSMVNRLLGSWFQLIRHRDLSVYLTLQAFFSLDKMLRWQTDVVFQCYDLHFKYDNLSPGSRISQVITDWSGVLTGRALTNENDSDAWQRNTRTRIMNGKLFWDTYDTEAEFDILAAMTKVQLKREVKMIDSTGRVYSPEMETKIQDMVDAIKSYYPQGTKFTAKAMKDQLRAWEIKDAKGALEALKRIGGINIGADGSLEYSGAKSNKAKVL